MRKFTRIAAVLTAAAISAGATVVGSAAPAGAQPSPGGSSSSIASAPGSGKLVVDWNTELLQIQKAPGVQPATVHPTRSFAILDAAIYDAVVSITHGDRPYRFAVTAPRTARPDAAADQAAHDTLASLYPSMKPQVDQLLATELAAIPAGTATTAGAQVGRAVATKLLALRSNDGSAVTPPPFVPGTQPGNYRPTPPKFSAPQFTNWGTVTPFVLTSGKQFRPAPPPALSSQAYADAINEVRSLGQNTSTTRTPDQTIAAQFWSPPIWNTWNEITANLVTQQRTSLERTSKIFSELNLTFADASIAMYNAKYHYQLWRPITAINLAVGNPAITADPGWTPLLTTAADPSYPGAHSVISEAGATVLSAFFAKNTHLTVTSDGLVGVTRSFNGFQAAASEAGLSRIYGGVHTRLDHVAGLDLGRDVAQLVLIKTATPTFGPLLNN
ncbi:MAG TPA: vanadium-dependent haloperoxidase [Acidimicrobiales bacterium]|nr:vanadium-dependent haloperoxidase [Acidimicrobiales bacterium]